MAAVRAPERSELQRSRPQESGRTEGGASYQNYAPPADPDASRPTKRVPAASYQINPKSQAPNPKSQRWLRFGMASLVFEPCDKVGVRRSDLDLGICTWGFGARDLHLGFGAG